MGIAITPKNVSLESYDKIGMGSFRLAYIIPECSERFPEYAGKVLKLPISGNPESMKINSMEFRFYMNEATPEIRNYLAPIRKAQADGSYLIMDYLGDEVPSSNHRMEIIKSRIRDNSKIEGVKMQSDLDLRRDNFRLDSNEEYKLIDYPFCSDISS